jgi:hypothetical protein
MMKYSDDAGRHYILKKPASSTKPAKENRKVESQPTKLLINLIRRGIKIPGSY